MMKKAIVNNRVVNSDDVYDNISNINFNKLYFEYIFSFLTI